MRVRPWAAHERGQARCIQCGGGDGSPSAAATVRLEAADSGCERCFGFTGVFDSHQGTGDQESVFRRIGAPMVQSTLEGFNTCVFTLGQTGTGKTHSLLGTPRDPGIFPRVLDRILESGRRCRLSCLEIHVDRLHDLLADHSPQARRDSTTDTELVGDDGRHLRGPSPGPSPGSSECAALEIRRHPDLGSYVSNLTEVLVEDAADARRLVASAARARTVAKTRMNAQSSRGHAIFQLVVADSGARLLVVDLAGRESERTSGSAGSALTELGYINRSLFHLTSVLQALARPQAGVVVPFRNSKLTLLLADCLLGARTFLLATVSPADCSAEETFATLRLAHAVQQIRTRSRKHWPQPEPPEPEPPEEEEELPEPGSPPGSSSPSPRSHSPARSPPPLELAPRLDPGRCAAPTAAIRGRRPWTYAMLAVGCSTARLLPKATPWTPGRELLRAALEAWCSECLAAR